MTIKLLFWGRAFFNHFVSATGATLVQSGRSLVFLNRDEGKFDLGNGNTVLKELLLGWKSVSKTVSKVLFTFSAVLSFLFLFALPPRLSLLLVPFGNSEDRYRCVFPYVTDDADIQRLE